jgi:hypothetical protein
LSYGGQVANPPFCNGLRLVNPFFALSIRRALEALFDGGDPFGAEATVGESKDDAESRKS